MERAGRLADTRKEDQMTLYSDLHNPFSRPEFIRLGWEDATGFFITTTNIEAGIKLVCGPAQVAATLLLANGVRHFDYDDSLFNNCDATDEFLAAARAVGFEA
jgi:hypothetical protein